MIEFRKILLPVDFSPLSEVAARYGSRLAERFESRIHVVHVVPAGALAATVPEQVTKRVASPQPRLADAQRLLEAFVLRHLAGLPVTQRAVCGEPAAAIVREASEAAADLIVMGTHADGVMKRLVFGSVSKSVLESAPCAVLLVPLAAARSA